MKNISRQMCSHPKSLANILQALSDRLDDLEAIQTKPFKGMGALRNKRHADAEAKAEAARKRREAEAARADEQARAEAKAEAEEDALAAVEREKQAKIQRSKDRAKKGNGMKTTGVILLAILMAVPAFGVIPITRRNVSTARLLDTLLRDRIGTLDSQVAALQAGGLTASSGTTYYVDSTNGADTFDGKSWTTAKATLEAAFGITALTAGDTIELAAGGTEAVGGADGVDMDVAGVYVKSWGYGTDRYAFTYDATGDELVVGADNITIENVQVIAGVSSITMAISIEAVDNTTFINCFAPKPTTNSWEFLDTIDVADGANNILIYGFEAYNDEAGAAPAHFIDAGNGTAGPERLQIARCTIKGDFSVSAIWSDEPCDEAFITANTITNHTTGEHCIEFTDTGTGVISHNNLYTDAAATTLDPGSMYAFENYVTTAINASAVIVPAYDDTVNNLIGVDDAANLGLTTNVTSDRDGSILERLEFLVKYLETGTPGALVAPASTFSLLDILGSDGSTTTGAVAGSLLGAIGTNEAASATAFSSTTVEADADGSALERLEYVSYWTGAVNAQTDTNNCDSADLFDVAGGDILIEQFVGIVTEAVDSNVASVKIIIDRDDGAADTEFSTSVAVTSDVLGTVYIFTNANAAVLTPLTPGAVGSSTLMSPWFCPEGMVETVFTASNSDGSISWYMKWRPLVSGVTVTTQ